MTRSSITIVSKSRWEPATRREHALARLAVRHGHGVVFLESPVDVRGLLSRDAAWWRRPQVICDVSVRPRRTLAPAHRGHIAEAVDARLLDRRLSSSGGDPRDAVVATLPWQWPSVERVRRTRRILDLADDWTALIPRRASRVRELCRRAAGEADGIIVASPDLGDLFPGREVQVVHNATDETLVASEPTRPPGNRRLVYVGTLSERFDARLVSDLLDRLTGWTLSLWGQCRYSGRGDRPDAALEALLSRTDGRAAWHGVVAREALASTLDGGDVLLLPNRHGLSRGQDSMKLYDYAARGRPIVATTAAVEGIATAPPGLRHAATAGDLADLVRESATEPPSLAAERVRWAGGQTWEARWAPWRAAVLADRADDAGSPGSTAEGGD